MARVKGPLFSLSASGTFNGIIEYRTGNGSTVAAGIKTCIPPRTPAQTAQITRFKNGIAGWRAAGATQQNAWKTAAPQGVTGYRFYLSEYMNQNIQPPGQPQIP